MPTRIPKLTAEVASPCVAQLTDRRRLEPELREARNVYVWNDADAARAFFTPEMRSRIAALYGVAPIIEYGEVAALVDNQA